MPEIDPYDLVTYPGHPFPQTDPDRLAVLAALHGLTAPPAPRSRVLEIGCGNGENLLPFALRWPETDILGIDLNAQGIAQGAASAAALGLRNIRFEALDIMRIGPELGQFDYIIAHGVYSWVPPVVREKILALVKAHLTPTGVAYVSYNTYPGNNLHQMARQMMLYHAGAIADPARRIEESRSLMRFLADATPANEVYGIVLRGEYDRVSKKSDHVFFHDDLEPFSTPFWFHEFVADAGRNGLQFLSEAAFSTGTFGALPDSVRQVFAAIPAREIVMREQYLDFVKGRGFRMSLLCHDDVALTREIAPGAVRGFKIASALVPAGAIDPNSPDAVAFTSPKDETLTIDHRLTKAALLALAEQYPQVLDFTDLVAAAQARLGGGEASEEDIEAMAGALFQAYAGGLIELKLYPPELATEVGEYPESSPIARHQIRDRTIITNLTHNSVSLTDETVRSFVGLVDGTRTREQLLVDLRAAVAGSSDAKVLDEVGLDGIDRNLTMLARLGLMAR